MQNTKLNEFQKIWSSNFGYNMTEAQGLEEMEIFLRNDFTNLKTLSYVLKDFGERHAEAIEEMRPTPKPPTVILLKKLYYKRISDYKSQPQGNCCVCNNNRYLYLIVNRDGTPLDYKETPWSKYTGHYTLTECPACTQKLSPEMRHKLIKCGLPLTVYQNHQSYPPSATYPMSASEVMRYYMQKLA